MEESYTIFWHNEHVESIYTCYCQTRVGKHKLSETVDQIKEKCGPGGYYVINNQNIGKL